jgi:hypothetical protein
MRTDQQAIEEYESLSKDDVYELYKITKEKLERLREAYYYTRWCINNGKTEDEMDEYRKVMREFLESYEAKQCKNI